MEHTYSVGSNPVYYDKQNLHVLFAGQSQTIPMHQAGPKIYDYYLLHFIESGSGVFRTEHHKYALGKGDFSLFIQDSWSVISQIRISPGAIAGQLLLGVRLMLLCCRRASHHKNL